MIYGVVVQHFFLMLNWQRNYFIQAITASDYEHARTLYSTSGNIGYSGGHNCDCGQTILNIECLSHNNPNRKLVLNSYSFCEAVFKVTIQN